ncbi:MAG: Lrp/AsnC family transcriptional regulator [Thermoplasmata archaeon]|nr:Lrp/AsnC family transcriptional regulator [Thermoplasmata archaeon]
MIDQKDKRIIEILQKNARIPNTEIAKMLGISESTVRKRINDLESKGVIKKYTVVVDPSKIGYNTVTILGVDVDPTKFLDVAKELAKLPETKYVATSTGDHMIMAEIWTKDGQTLAELISNRIGKIGGVKRICPAIILEKIKE